MESNYFPPTEKEAKEAGVTSSERRNAGFPSRLRQLRNKKGESQATLAKELMVTKSTISLYETGDNVPDARTIRRMAEHFDVSADYLLGLSESETNDKDMQFVGDYIGLSSEAIDTLRFFKNIDPFLFDFLEYLIVEANYKPDRLNEFLCVSINYGVISALNCAKQENEEHLDSAVSSFLLRADSQINGGIVFSEGSPEIECLAHVPKGMGLLSAESMSAFFEQRVINALSEAVKEYIACRIEKEASNAE